MVLALVLAVCGWLSLLVVVLGLCAAAKAGDEQVIEPLDTADAPPSPPAVAARTHRRHAARWSSATRSAGPPPQRQARPR
jgi:hypothetical protein